MARARADSIHRKSIPIQGTSVLLDTPEALDAWVAERRKRFPTAERVHEKKRKMEEAIARGQLAPEDMGLAGRKRHKHDHATDGSIAPSDGRGKRGRGRGRGRGMGRGRGTYVNREAARSAVNEPKPAVEPVSLDGLVQEYNAGTSPESEEEPPEEISSKSLPVSKVPCTLSGRSVPETKASSKPSPLQPRQPRRNAFSRPTLLRNVGMFFPHVHN